MRTGLLAAFLLPLLHAGFFSAVGNQATPTTCCLTAKSNNNRLLMLEQVVTTMPQKATTEIYQLNHNHNHRGHSHLVLVAQASVWLSDSAGNATREHPAAGLNDFVAHVVLLLFLLWKKMREGGVLMRCVCGQLQTNWPQNCSVKTILMVQCCLSWTTTCLKTTLNLHQNSSEQRLLPV